jgi:hypothetical protein
MRIAIHRQMESLGVSLEELYKDDVAAAKKRHQASG